MSFTSFINRHMFSQVLHSCIGSSFFVFVCFFFCKDVISLQIHSQIYTDFISDSHCVSLSWIKPFLPINDAAHLECCTTTLLLQSKVDKQANKEEPDR